jgi:hypothetical protein
LDAAGKIARAVLYEGYLLYPYTLSSTKNRQRWTFGGLYPPAYVLANPGSDASSLTSECLISGNEGTEISVHLRFLELFARGTEQDPWEEATEREFSLEGVRLNDLLSAPRRLDFAFPGRLEVSSRRLEEGLFLLGLHVANRSMDNPLTRRQALLRSMVSTHLALSTAQGEFVSLIDPPARFREWAGRCQNRGWWPVLTGNQGERHQLLVSPIILYDYPQIAPESPGDLFDGGEIDEVLSLRILTLTDEEKEEIRRADSMGREMLERTERLSEEELIRLHGTWRNKDGRPTGVQVGEVLLKPGSRVRLRPKKITDAFDVILTGMNATVQSVEQDLEGQYHLCVSVDADPGKDLERKAQLGHRFFFRPEEVEPI